MVLFRSSNVGLLPGRTTDKTRLPSKRDNVQQWRGPRFAPIFKADAKAHSAYVLDLEYDTGQRRPTTIHQVPFSAGKSQAGKSQFRANSPPTF
jgi:hypothetical protein